VVWEGTSKDCTELLQNADVAMYEAKRQGESRHVVFTPAMYEDVDNRFALTRELGHSLQSGEISMHYQPLVNLATSEVVGFEALMRWEHPKRGQVPPGVFIPLAEQSDLIFELGSFALREAVAEASSWERHGCSGKPAFCHGQPLRAPVPRPGPGVDDRGSAHDERT